MSIPRADRHVETRAAITFGWVWAAMKAACPPGEASAMVVKLCKAWLSGGPWPAFPPGVEAQQPAARVPAQRSGGIPAAVFVAAPGPPRE